MRNHKPVVDVPLMRKYGCNAQCVASYPQAKRFAEGFDAVAYRRHLEQRSIGGLSRPLQLYIHAPRFPVPAGNMTATESPSMRGALWDIEREIAAVDQALRGNRRVLKLHCSGRSAAERPSRIMETLQSVFDFDENGESAIELDATRDRDHAHAGALERLRLQGFNRVAIRVAAVPASRMSLPGRSELTPAEAQSLIGAARVAGFRAIDVELAYGDRGQSAAEFQDLMERVVALTPDRVTLVADPLCVAMRGSGCPGAHGVERQIALFAQAVEGLDSAGYQHVALGHFSLPNDRLAIASRNGSLARNYGDYSVGLHCDRIAFGPAAVSNVGPLFVQNAVDPDRYRSLLDRGLLPIERGIELGTDELLRKAVIDAFACQSEVSKDAVSAAYMIDFDAYFASELAMLKDLADDGVVEFDREWIAITPRGKMLAGLVGDVFDKGHGTRPHEPLTRVQSLHAI